MLNTTIRSLTTLTKTHIVAILLSIICGLFIVAPQLIFIKSEGEAYKGYYMMMSTESEWYYLARMHEFYDEGKIGNPFLYEHRYHGPIFISPGGEMLLALPGKLFNISIPTLNLIEKFVLPLLTFLLLYALLFRLTASLSWSVAGAFMFLIGSTWLYANNLSHLLRGDLWWNEFIYNRPVHPQFDGVLTFLYLNVLLSIVQEGKKIFYIFLSLLLGLSFYTYFYSFTFFLALSAVLVCVWFFMGRRKDAGYLSIATIFGLIIGVPALLAIYIVTKHPDYAQITAYGTQFSHMPEISKNGILVSLLFTFYLMRTKALNIGGVAREHALLIIALLVTTFVVVNQQVLTGISLHSGHYHHNFNIPVFIIVLMFLGHAASLMVLTWRPTLKKLITPIPWALTMLFLATGVFIQYSSYIQSAPQAREDQRFIPAFTWIENDTPPESVIMANEKLSELIPVYTSKNVMWSLGATNYLMPPERARFTPDNLLASQDFLRDIKQYRVDYILWDKRTDPTWNIDRFNLPVVYSADDLIIYQLPK